MKKLLTVFLAIVLLLSLISCKSDNTQKNTLPLITMDYQGNLFFVVDRYLHSVNFREGYANNWNTPSRLMDDVISITTTGMSCAAVTSDGSIYYWGNNSLGVGGSFLYSEDKILQPKKVYPSD